MSIVLYEVKNRMAFITINRPEKRNALNPELVELIKKRLADAENDAAVKVVILKANGDAFCAGADLSFLKEMQAYSFEQNLADSQNLRDLFLQIYTHPKIVIAQVQGNALAGGCGLATVCDFIFSVEHAKFGYTEVKIGFIPALVSVFLVLKLGEQKARELLLSGKIITAPEAKTLGMVTEIVDRSDLNEAVENFALNLIKSNSAQSMQMTKELLYRISKPAMENALQLAAELNAQARGTEDCKRGINAFLNKETLTW